MSSIPQAPGIYKIVCFPTGKFYIGSTANLRERWRHHCKELRANRHGNLYLQHAWNKYGEGTFDFEIIELVMPWSLLDREQYWLDKLQPYNRDIGFNIAQQANTPSPTPEVRAKISAAHKGKSRAPHSSETRAKISAAHRGKKRAPLSAETRAKLSLALVGNKNNLGHRHTSEAKAKVSAANKGKTLSPETRAKISEAAKGRKHSPESRAKMSMNRFGYIYSVISPQGNEIIVCNLNRFCKEHNLSQSRMSAVSRGQQLHHKGWKVRRIK